MKEKASTIIAESLERGATALSERDSKILLAEYGIPVTPERLAASADEAVEAARELGYPVVLKACGAEITHKTERGLVAVHLDSDDELREAFEEIASRVSGETYDGILVQPMISGERELVVGLIRDPQFGPCVMFGLGGIFTEILRDTAFRVAPIREEDAMQMMEEIKAKAILGPVRGMPPADKEKLAGALVGLARLGLEQDNVAEVDVNPLKLDDRGEPVAVDALVILSGESSDSD